MEDNTQRENGPGQGENERKLKRIFQDRERTNVLKNAEQITISFLVKRIPSFITSDMLTFTGTFGSLIVLTGFILGSYVSREYLLLGIPGLAINWFGDSMDGRVAYYRNTPRKWYGFSLDIIMDWVSTVIIGMGYMVYAKDAYEIIAFFFVVFYGWAMIISQLRYKITDVYSIDAGLLGPTEMRIILALMLITEVIFGNVLDYFAIAICLSLFITNFIDTRKLLKQGDLRDKAERAAKQNQS